GATGRSRRCDDIGRACRRRAGAHLVRIAEITRAGPAGGAGADERVAGAGGPRAGAVFGDVTRSGGGTADGARRLEVVGRAGGAAAVALLGDVADAGRRAAGGAGVAGGMLAGVVHAVALVERAGVPVARTARAVRLLRVGGAVHADAVA